MTISTAPFAPARARLIQHRRRDPVPRFRPDVCAEVDPVWGCLELQIPEDHLAREVKAQVERLDLSKLEAKYSSQGRHGFHPRHVLGALVFASRIGLHHSTRIAEAMRTDAALRFVAGGHRLSEGRLRAFRRSNGDFFAEAVQQTIQFAKDDDLLDPRELAIDSVRLRAEASTKAVGTLKRSQKRLEELAKIDVAALNEIEATEHRAKVAKHTETIRLCKEREATSYVSTSPSAGLMMFPNGAGAPGHRITTVGCGVQLRLIIDVLIDGAATDYGKLSAAVLRARKALKDAGVSLESSLQMAADAGYFSVEDLVFAAANRAQIDILIAEGKAPQRKSKEGLPIFTSDDFKRVDGKLVCPANREMSGPFKDGQSRNHSERWLGQGCGTCGLKPQCTAGKYRSVTIDLQYQAARDEMRQRMAQPGAKQRYNQRIATVEPIFSSLQDDMGFRRVSSLKAQSVRAEVLLKVLAYNLSRLTAARRLRHARLIATASVSDGESHAG